MKTIVSLVVALFIGLASFAQTDQDKQAILQQCIDLPALQSYLHPEQAGRVPLIMVNNGTIPVVQLSKFGKAVVFQTDDELDASGNKAALDFVRFDVTAESATAIFRYKAEGIMLTVLFKKNKNEWIVSDSKIVER